MTVLFTNYTQTRTGIDLETDYTFEISINAARAKEDISVVIDGETAVWNTDYTLKLQSSTGTSNGFTVQLKGKFVSDVITATRTSVLLQHYRPTDNQALGVSFDDIVMMVQEAHPGDYLEVTDPEVLRCLPRYISGKAIMWSEKDKKLITSKYNMDDLPLLALQHAKAAEGYSIKAEQARENIEVMQKYIQKRSDSLEGKLAQTRMSSSQAMKAQARTQAIEDEVEETAQALHKELERLNDYVAMAENAAERAAHFVAQCERLRNDLLNLKLDVEDVERKLSEAVSRSAFHAGQAKKEALRAATIVDEAKNVLAALVLMIEQAKEVLAQGTLSRSTGVVSGYVSTLIDETTVEYSEGEAQFVSGTSVRRVASPSPQRISPLAGETRTHVFVDTEGRVYGRARVPSAAELYDLVYLGHIRTALGTPTQVADRPTMVSDTAAQLRDITGDVSHLRGQAVDPIETTLSFAFSEAQYSGFSVHRVSPSRMLHEKVLAAQNPAIFDIVAQRDVLANSVPQTTFLQSTNYENESGTLSNLVGQQAIIYVFWREATGASRCVYPQVPFDDLDDAVAQLEAYITNLHLNDRTEWYFDSALAGAWLVSKDTTDLSDPEDAVWVGSGSIITAGGGAEGFVTDPQFSNPGDTLECNATRTTWSRRRLEVSPRVASPAVADTFPSVNIAGDAYEHLRRYPAPVGYPVGSGLQIIGSNTLDWIAGTQSPVAQVRIPAQQTLQFGDSIDNFSSTRARPPGQPLTVDKQIYGIDTVFLQGELTDVVREGVDAGFLGALHRDERYAPKNETRSRDLSGVSSLIKAAVSGDDPLDRGGVYAMPAASDWVHYDVTQPQTGMLVEEFCYNAAGTFNRHGLVGTLAQTTIDTAAGDSTCVFSVPFKHKALSFQYSYAIGTSGSIDIGNLTWALFGRDTDVDPWTPVLSTVTGSNEIVLGAGSFASSLQTKYTIPINSEYTWYQYQIQIVSGTEDCTMRRSYSDSSSWGRTCLCEDGNLEGQSFADTRLLGSNGIFPRWTGDTAAQAVSAGGYSPFPHSRDIAHNFGLIGRFSADYVSDWRANTTASSSGSLHIYDKNFEAENSSWISLPVPGQENILRSGHVYSSPNARIHPSASYLELYTSSSADPIIDDFPAADPTIREIHAGIPTIEAVIFSSVFQGTGAVDPADFSTSTIDLLDINQDLIATVTVAHVVRAYTDIQWEASAKRYANDALIFAFDITPYPLTRFFTHFTPNKAEGTDYQGSLKAGYYQALLEPTVPSSILHSHYLKDAPIMKLAYDPDMKPKWRHVPTGKFCKVVDWDRPKPTSHTRAEHRLRVKCLTDNLKACEANFKCHEATRTHNLQRPIPQQATAVRISIKPLGVAGQMTYKGLRVNAQRSPRYASYGRFHDIHKDDKYTFQPSKGLCGSHVSNYELHGGHGETSCVRAFKCFHESDCTIIEFPLIANTQPRLDQHKIAHYTVWHTTLDNVVLPEGAEILDVSFKTIRMCRESDGELNSKGEKVIAGEKWHTEAGKVITHEEGIELQKQNGTGIYNPKHPNYVDPNTVDAD